MRARAIDLLSYEGARHGVRRGLVGIGERLSPRPDSFSEALLITAGEHGHKAARMLSRFAEIPESTLVWTQVADDDFRLGQIVGPWFYDASPEAARTGIHQVRPAAWLGHPVSPAEAPAAVLDSFARGGRNLQRIKGGEAEGESRRIWLAGEFGESPFG